MSQPARAQRREIADGGLGARQQDQVGIARQRVAGLDQLDAHIRLGAQRVEIVEIGDARQPRHRDLDRARSSARAIAVQRHRILRRQQVRASNHGTTPRLFSPVARFDRREAVLEQQRIAAELVDEIALDAAPPRPSGSSAMVPTMRGDDPAALDVADQQHRHVGRLGETHVGDVALAQVDLRRAAGAFDQHQVGLRGQAARSCPAPPAAAAASARDNRAPWPGPRPCPAPPPARRSRDLRLQQHRVHVHRRRHPAGPRLQRLGAPDLAAFRRHRRVVRHVLRLERPHPPARRAKARHSPATISDLPTSEPVPWNMMAGTSHAPDNFPFPLAGKDGAWRAQRA